MGSIGYWRVTYVAFTHPVILTRNIIVGGLLRAASLWEAPSAKIANGLTLYISQSQYRLIQNVLHSIEILKVFVHNTPYWQEGETWVITL